jgi:phosphatidate cytidylyltransferase
MLALVVIMLMEMQRFRGPGRAVARAGVTLLAVVSILLPLSFLLHLRLISPDRIGLLALVSLIFVVKSADTGAFTAGRMFGKHAMSPKLSPKKTIEGAVGGVLAAVLAAWFFLRVFMPWATGTNFRTPHGLAVLLYGFSLAVAGMFGDLSVSLIKRDVDRKDSSSWLPGLGGLLDVLDSLLWTAPIAYVWWAWA